MSDTPSPKPVGLNPSARPLNQRNYRTPLIAASGVLVAVVLIGALVAAVSRGESEPPLNADTLTLVKFVNEPAYQKLPFPRQQLYMKVLEDRDDNDQLEDAFDAGQITEDQFRAAILEACLGQQLKRSDKFHGYANEQARLRYVRELRDKKRRRRNSASRRRTRPAQRRKSPPTPSSATTCSSSSASTPGPPTSAPSGRPTASCTNPKRMPAKPPPPRHDPPRAPP